MHRDVGGATVTIIGKKATETEKKEFGVQGDNIRLCHLSVRDPEGKTVLKVRDFGIDLLPAFDIDGDGSPEIITESYSGGAHCCWTYRIYSITKHRLLAELENERDISFGSTNGRVELYTLDGAFDYFDGAAHTQAVFPSVFLRFENGKLHDVSREF